MAVLNIELSSECIYALATNSGYNGDGTAEDFLQDFLEEKLEGTAIELKYSKEVEEARVLAASRKDEDIKNLRIALNAKKQG